MKHRLPKYVHGFEDRHGRTRYYFRRGSKRTPLPGLPWSTEFMDAHAAAMAQQEAPINVGATRTIPGTVSALVAAYFNSSAFRDQLAPSTQATYRNIIQRFRDEHGSKRVALLERTHIVAMLGKKAKTPSAANNFLRMVRMLMQFALVEGLRRDDPTMGLKALKTNSEGFHTWTENEVATFEARHPMGSKARLALALMLYTAQRRGDAVTMGRQHIKNSFLRIRQEKTNTIVEIPIHSDLRAIIDATPNGDMTFLVTELGKPFTAAGFGNWFRDRCDEAGLAGCSAHGLRKAACRRLAEAGCTPHEIMAISGHKTLKEVTRYTAAVDRKQLAVSAMQKIESRTGTGKP